MQLKNGILYFSATDLNSFQECRHLIELRKKALTSPIPRDPKDEFEEVLANRGIAHERRYLQQLQDQGKTVIDLTGIKSEDERLGRLLDELARGTDVLYQGYLEANPFVGYADFLVKTDESSNLGAHSYEAYDTKLAQAYCQPRP